MAKFNEDAYFEKKLNKHLKEQEPDICSECGLEEDECECEEYESESDAHENAMWDKADAQNQLDRDER